SSAERLGVTSWWAACHTNFSGSGVAASTTTRIPLGVTVSVPVNKITSQTWCGAWPDSPPGTLPLPLRLAGLGLAASLSRPQPGAATPHAPQPGLIIASHVESVN